MKEEERGVWKKSREEFRLGSDFTKTTETMKIDVTEKCDGGKGMQRL